jgi:hypothetical protein
MKTATTYPIHLFSYVIHYLKGKTGKNQAIVFEYYETFIYYFFAVKGK